MTRRRNKRGVTGVTKPPSTADTILGGLDDKIDKPVASAADVGKAKVRRKELDCDPPPAPLDIQAEKLKELKSKIDDPVAHAVKVQENKAKARRNVERRRRCPICWHGYGGFAIGSTTRDIIRHYKCCHTHDKNGEVVSGGCGYSWKHAIKLAELPEVNHREVILHTR